MTSADVTSADELVTDYLKRLEGELSDLPGDDLPRARRREIVEEVSAHIAEARASGGVESDAEVLTLLDRIGDPDEIVAEARAARLDPHPATPGSREVWTLVLLGAGGIFLPLVGWIVGVFLLWGSPVWSRKEKLIGTLATVGLAPGPWLYLSWVLVPEGTNISTAETLFDLGWTLMVFVGLGAITYLAVRLRRRSKLAARLVAFQGHEKGPTLKTPALLGVGVLALGLLAYVALALTRGDDGRSEADMRADVTKVGNEWAPLFAKDALAACDLMYTPSSPPGPLCVRFYRNISARRPSQFQKSFAGATVTSVAIVNYHENQTGGTLALAEFSNGEQVRFIQTPPLGGNNGGRQELHQGVGWFVYDLGPGVRTRRPQAGTGVLGPGRGIPCGSPSSACLRP
jgi:hypothetical protein